MKFKLIVVFCLFAGALLAQPKPGTVFPNGKPGVDYNLLNAKGKRDGLWVKSWKSTGNLLYRGHFKNGVPAGKWERYFDDGFLMAIEDHVKDTTVVDVTYYHRDGVTEMSKGRYVKKQKEGNWKLWNEQGVLLADENFKDSLNDGTCKYFYPNGSVLKVENYKSGLKDGGFIEYYENGKKRAEGSCLHDEKDGPYKSYYESGNAETEGRYVKGLQDGTWYYSYKTGKPEVTMVYRMGKEVKRRYENGIFKEYYDSGIPKSEYSYENGLKDGSFTDWYDKGQYVQVPGTKEDQENGIVYREKLEGTQIKVHGDYLDDKLEGEVIYYRENGSVEKIEEWTDGVLIKTRAAAK